MEKAVVTAIHEGQAVVLLQNGTFVEVKDREYQVGQQISFRKRSYKKYAALAASVMLLVFGGFSGYAVTQITSSYVYVDINPSFRLDINPFASVISVVPLNEDAENLLQHVELYNKDICTCVENIIVASEMAEYINETNTDVEISMVSVNEKTAEKVFAFAETNMQTLEISATEVTASECEEALEVGISAGRLEAVKAYTEYFGGNVEENVDLLEELSVRKIYSEISSAQRVVEQAVREAEREAAKEQREQERAEREAAKEQREQKRAEREAAKEQREQERAEREAAKEQREQERIEKEAAREEKRKEREEQK